MQTFSDIAAGYAEDVLADRVVVGAWVRKAVRRHMDDLARTHFKDPPYAAAWPYRYDEAAGARVCGFVQTLPHVKGEWARRGERMLLAGWQVFLLMTLFGWVRKSDGRRRFRECYLEVARKNGKSQISAAVGLYMLLADREYGAEVFAGASTEHQAWEVFGCARRMLEATPKLRERTGAQVLARVITGGDAGGKFEPLSSKPGDGSTPSCALIDEFHEHDTPELIDALQTGMGSREQPLTFITTTAGSNIACPCFDKRDQVQKMLDGVVANEELLGLIYAVDDADDWTDPRILPKANPNIDVSVSAEALETEQRNAVATVTGQHRFQTKKLCRWVSVRSAWMDMGLWNAAAITKESGITERSLIDAGAKCIFSGDFATKVDFCVVVRLYQHVIGGKSSYVMFARYWLPEATVEAPGPNEAMYRKWVADGWLTQTDGATIDFEAVTETILADHKRINPSEFVYDPHTATRLAQDLMAEGVACVEFVQNPAAFGVPMDEVIAALKDKRFFHDGDPITTWCVSNTVARPVKKGLFAPMKSKPHLKIDGSVALAMAMARATTTDLQEPEPEFQSFFFDLGAPEPGGWKRW